MQQLKLSMNQITSDGVPAIVLVMENCCHVIKLDLISNNIRIDGAASLVEGWKHKTLLTINLEYNLDPHESSLLKREKHCPDCDSLLQLQLNDYIIIRLGQNYTPKLVSMKDISQNVKVKCNGEYFLWCYSNQTNSLCLYSCF